MDWIDPNKLVMPERIETDRLLIRPPRVEDALEVNTAIRESIAMLRPWMDWAQQLPRVEQTRSSLAVAEQKYLAREDFWLFLFLKDDKTLVGCSGLHEPNWRVPKFEIGYWVRARYGGQGYITEAVAAIARFAFEHFRAKRVEIRMSAKNERSSRVAERLGFELEGILRNDERHVDGSLRDTKVFAKVVP